MSIVGILIISVAILGTLALLWGRRGHRPPARSIGAVVSALAMVAATVLVIGGGVIGGGRSADAAIVPAVPLLTLENYSVLASSTVTNTGDSTLGLSLGLSPGTSVTGFPPGLVVAPGVADVTTPAAAQAQLDLTAAYVDAAGRTGATVTPADLVNLILPPGVYSADNKGPLGLTGPLTLDAAGNPNAVFIFQTDSTLITGSSSTVNLINGAQECNVFWQVGSSATLGTSSVFAGNILAQASVTVTNSVTVHGRALARTAAVTLDNDTFTVPTCLLATDSVSVTKTVKPSNLPSWSVDFTISPDPGDGPVTKTATKVNPTVTWTNLDPDQLYTITETTPSGWTAGVLTCSTFADTPPAGPSRAPHPMQPAMPSASFTSGGFPVTCAIENLGPPVVRFSKTTNGGVAGPFTLRATNEAGTVIYGDAAATTLVAGVALAATPGAIVVAAGNVMVSEVGPLPAGWFQGGISCTIFEVGGGQRVVSGTSPVTLGSFANGEYADCSVVNNAAASVSVTKTVKPSTLPSWSIPFTITPDPGDGLQTKNATNGSPTVTWNNLDPSVTYTITEMTPAGWQAGSVDCGKGSASFEPGAAATVTCTVVNIGPPRVLIQKRSEGGTGAFQFDVVSGDPQSTQMVAITTTQVGVAQPLTPQAVVVVPGTVTVSETGLASGFAPVSLVCERFDADGQSLGTTIDSAGALSLSVTLAIGEELRCVATNEKLATVSVTKTVVGPAPWSFDFTISPDPDGAGGQSATQQATNLAPIVTWTGLDPYTTYTVTETPVAGYSASALACIGDTGVSGPARLPHVVVAGVPPIGPSDSITPGPGDVITCTITNTDTRITDIGVVKTPSVPEVLLGDTVVWTLSVVNIGPAVATNVVINDTLPADLAFVSVTPPAGWDCTLSNAGPPPLVHCEKASMAVGETAVFSVVTTVVGLTENGIVNYVYVGTSTRELVVSNNAAHGEVVTGELPNTGGSVNGLAGLGLALLGAGAAFHLLGRRRTLRHATAPID